MKAARLGTMLPDFKEPAAVVNEGRGGTERINSQVRTLKIIFKRKKIFFCHCSKQNDHIRMQCGDGALNLFLNEF